MIISTRPAAEAGAPPDRRGRGLLLAVAGFFILIKIGYVLFAGPIADEAYYWLWGQHPGLSYFDHPPFHAWLLGLQDALLGNSLLAFRTMTLLTMVGTFYIYHLWMKRIAGPNWPELFLAAVVIHLASTTFGFFTSLAQHDYMLVFLALLSGHFFITYLSAVRESGAGRLRDLYCGAFVLGLVGLTKYSGVLFGVGLFVYLLLSPKLRRLFGNPHLYGAALLAIALQAPILVWNAQHGFASFSFHLSDRHPEGWLSAINWLALSEFLLVSLLLISPFLVPAFVRFLLARPATAFEETARGLGASVFWVSSLLFLAISLFDRVWWWWNLLAYVLLLPFAAKYLGRGLLFWAHIVLGALLQLFLLISSTLLPLSLVFGISDPVRSTLFGWQELGAAVSEAKALHQPDFVAAMRSEVAGLVAFATDDRDVTALTPINNQFDYWFVPGEHRGEDALVVLRDGDGADYIASQFATVTQVGELVVDRFGYRLGSYQILFAEGYAPGP